MLTSAYTDKPLSPFFTRALSQFIHQALETIKRYDQRHRQRRALLQLDARLLDDIALSSQQVRCEARKYFWQ